MVISKCGRIILLPGANQNMMKSSEHTVHAASHDHSTYINTHYRTHRMTDKSDCTSDVHIEETELID